MNARTATGILLAALCALAPVAHAGPDDPVATPQCTFEQCLLMHSDCLATLENAKPGCLLSADAAGTVAYDICINFKGQEVQQRRRRHVAPSLRLTNESPALALGLSF